MLCSFGVDDAESVLVRSGKDGDPFILEHPRHLLQLDPQRGERASMRRASSRCWSTVRRMTP